MGCGGILRTSRVGIIFALSLLLIANASFRLTPGSLASRPQLTGVSGPQRTVAILVDFPFQGNTTNVSRLSNTLVSMNDYYYEDSYGMVSFQFDISRPPTGSWYRMPNSMTYYGADTGSSDTELVRDALQAAYDAGVNLQTYTDAIVVHAGNDEAITHVTSDIHSYTIPSFVFTPTFLTRIPISASVVAETDPVGVYAHEGGHLLGLPDLYDITGTIDATNNFLGYWELMALGEWNPNTGNRAIAPGTYPSQMSSWSKIELGFIPNSRVATVQAGEKGNITLENIELPTIGIQAVKIPVAYNPGGSAVYYLLEMRAKQGTFDAYLPFPSTYPNAGLLIYKVDESIPSGSGRVKVIDAHPGGDLNDAAFGPCLIPCVSNNTFSDPSSYVKVIITNANSTAYSLSIDRTSSPPLLLQVDTPSKGVLVSVDGVNMTTDESGQLRMTVNSGAHTVYVESRIPVSVGGTSVQIGLSNVFVGWGDGELNNPRGLSVVQDTVLTAVYRITIEPSIGVAIGAFIILTVVAGVVAFHRRGRRTSSFPEPSLEGPSSPRVLEPVRHSQGMTVFLVIP